MNYGKFVLFTAIGAAAWHSILAALGWYLASFVSKEQLNATIERYNHYIIIAILGLVALAVTVIIARHYIKKKKEVK